MNQTNKTKLFVLRLFFFFLIILKIKYINIYCFDPTIYLFIFEKIHIGILIKTGKKGQGHLGHKPIYF